MGRLKGEGCILILTEASTLGLGLMTTKMETERKCGQMAASTKVFISLERSMVRGVSSGPTALFIMASFLKTTCTTLGAMSGLMGGSTPDNGTKIRWKGKGCSLGWTAGHTKENTSTTRSKASESSPGLMARSTKDSGIMGNKMEWGCSPPHKE